MDFPHSIPCLLAECYDDLSLMSIQFSPQQCQELERLYNNCPKPTSAFLEQLLHASPLLSSLDKQHVKLWFQTRRLKERLKDEQLYPLITKNAELKAEYQALVLQNNELRNRASLLHRANQRLKEQLEEQLQQKHSCNSSTFASVSFDRMSRHSFDSDDEETSQVQGYSSQD